MVKISDCCCPCEDKAEKDEIKQRALSSVNKIISTEGGTPYYPDGAGTLTMPVLDADDITKIRKDIEDVTDAEATDKLDIVGLKAKDENLQVQITAEHEKNGVQDTEITDLQGRMTGAESDLIATEAVVAQHTADIANVKADVVGVNAKADASTTAIAALQAKDTQHDQSIDALDTLTDSITKHLIDTVTVKDGTSNGSIIVEIKEEGGKVIASPNYPWGQVNTFELLQGSSEGMIKGRLTLSDGSVHESNDYRIVEVLESDIYVTAITLTPYPTTGKIGGTIGYSNGDTQAINAIDVPTAPGVTTNINDLLRRMGVVEGDITDLNTDMSGVKSRLTAVETKNTSQDSAISALQTKDTAIDGEIDALDERVKAIEDTPGIGKFSNTSLGTILGSAGDGKISAESDGTGSVNGWNSVKSDVDTAKNNISTLQSDMTTAKSDIGQLKISDAEHTETLATQGQQISAQAGEITTLKGTVAQHTNEIRNAYNSFDIVDGNLEMTTVGGETQSQALNIKDWKIFTGELSELIEYSNAKIFIKRDFIITYIDGYIPASTSVYVPKMQFLNEAGSANIFIAQVNTDKFSDAYIAPSSDGSIIVKFGNVGIYASQIKSEIIPKVTYANRALFMIKIFD